MAEECLGIAAKAVGVEMGKKSPRPVPAGRGYHRFHVGVAPKRHKRFGATLVFQLLEASESLNLGIEQYSVSRFLHRFCSAQKPAELRRVGRSNDPYGITFEQRSGSRQTRGT